MKYEPADIFFVAGEASGDLQASLLAGALGALDPSLRYAAIGGDRLRAAGAKLVYDSSELASIGPISVIPRLPQLYFMLHWLAAAMRRQPSRLFVPVDAGAFNLRLVNLLRGHGYDAPIIYYFPPGAWLDNPDQARAVASRTTALTPFTHQREFYRALNLPVEYFGHPLVSVIAQRLNAPANAKPLIAVLPGSRREEVMRHLPILAAAAGEMAKKASATFTIVASTAQRANQIGELWPKNGGPFETVISREGSTQVLSRADLAWVASGTAVLEAALVGVPQIAFYVVSPSQARIAKRRLPAHLLKSIALPNLVMGRAVIPELIQHDFTQTRLTTESMALLENQSRRARQKEDYAELRAALGPPDALARIAAFVADTLYGTVASG